MEKVRPTLVGQHTTAAPSTCAGYVPMNHFANRPVSIIDNSPSEIDDRMKLRAAHLADARGWAASARSKQLASEEG